MSKHTPGPWHHDEYGHICAGPQIIGIAYQFELDDSDYDELLCIPNARLMAAAPELLEFVRYVAKGIPVWDDPCSLEESVDHLEERAKRLVAKIEGDE
jgi:hypothetical protein